MADFINDQLDYIFFVYGLAMIMLAVVAFIIRKKKDGLPWILLGMFGLIHGMHEWLELLDIVVGSNRSLKTVHTIMAITSFAVLTEFGRAGLSRLRGKGPGPWILAPLAALAALGGTAGLEGLDISSRYTLGLAGGLLTSGTLFLLSKSQAPLNRRWLIAAASAFGLYTLASGIFVPHARFFPASFLNSATFLQATGVPVQLARALFAAVAALSLWAYSQLPAGDEAGADHNSEKNIFIPVGVLFLIIVTGGLLTVFAGNHSKEEEISEGHLLINAMAALLDNGQENAGYIDRKNLDRLGASMKKHPNSFLVDRHGTILMSGRENLLNKNLWPPAENRTGAASAQDRSGKGRSTPILDKKAVEGEYAWLDSSRFIVIRQPAGQSGWSIVLLRDTDLIMEYRLFAILTIFVFYGLAISFFVVLHFNKESAAKISVSERRYRGLVEGSPNWVMLFDQQGRCMTTNRAGTGLIGCDEGDIIGKRLDEIWPGKETASRMKEYTGQALSGTKCSFETEHTRCDGTRVVFSAVLNPIIDQDGKVRNFVGILVDITARKNAERDLKAYHAHLEYLIKERTAELSETNRLLKAEILQRISVEEQLRTSLKEKEVMLKEIHHRVKNNLQIICSLLNLQSMQIADKQALELFMESQNRVRSMALIHEKLYQTKDLANINFGDYIASLTAYLYHAYAIRSDLVKMRINSNNIFFSITTAIPCGLIINELVSNCLKHAFPAGKEGEITVDLYRHAAEAPTDTDTFTLAVKDNGAGLPDGFDLQGQKSLGLKLVATLAGQLDGNLEYSHSGGGAEFRITFRKDRQRTNI